MGSEFTVTITNNSDNSVTTIPVRAAVVAYSIEIASGSPNYASGAVGFGIKAERGFLSTFVSQPLVVAALVKTGEFAPPIEAVRRATAK